ncbi:MAG: GGDEF domain-containing protein [Clostridia bacterium]|nr:GGDEF domain-containing protein [Clostridia bacterium]
MEHAINRLAELKDKNIEKEFYNNEVKKGLRASRYIVLIFSIINLTFAFWDYLYLEYADISIIIYHSLIPRIVILGMGIIVFILLKKAETKNEITAIKSVIVYAILMYLLHEYTATHFAPVDLIFEALDLVIMTFGLFIVPNRWIINVCTAVFLIIVFVVLTPFTIPTMAEGTKVLITLYLFSQALIVSVLMYRINVQKRLNYLQQRQLEALADTDTLTKTPNRAACDKMLDQMCNGHCEFSLILIDIDDFKRINDTYGHIAGDEVIVKIIDTIKGVIRKNDIVTRWGGEEFIIMLPHTTLDKAAEIADRIKEFVSTIEYDKIIDKVTASFGVTEFQEGDDMKSIINRADQMLYLAKRHGKNKVVSG